MIRDDDSVKFYKRDRGFACFNLTLGLIQPYTQKKIKCWDKKKNGKSNYQNDVSKKKPGRQRHLSEKEEYLLVLCRLRLGVLGDMFGVSEASVCKIVTTSVCSLAKVFDGTLLRWPTREEVKRQFPKSFKNTLTPELSLMQLNFSLRSPHPHVLRRPHGVTTNTIIHLNYWSELHLVELLLSSRNCGQEAPATGRYCPGEWSH